MKRFHYMLMLLALLVCQNTKAQFNPEPPDEPGERPWLLTLKAVPAEAGYFNLNQQSRHVADEKIQLTAFTNSGYRFVCWEDSLGNTLTTERSWSYTMPEKNVTLTARYEYSPDAPDEPGQASIKKRLFLNTNPDGAGRFNLSGTNNIAVGQAVNLQVYGNQNYIFRNWTEDGIIISSAAAFTYTMPDKDVMLTANFDFDYQPGTPDEPGQPQLQTCIVYAMREDATAGQTCTFPVYFENNGSDVTGFSVDVSFPQGFTVNADNATLTGSVAAHSLSVSQLDAATWHFEVSGSGVVEKGDGKALLIPVSIPATATVSAVYAVELKNGIMVKVDGSQTSIKVRSGSLRIVRAAEEKPDSPDYVVTDVQTASSDVAPGDEIQVSWKVKNQGKSAGPARWTERIYLLSSTGRKVSIGMASYDSGQLQPGEAVSRSAALTLGKMPGIDGKLNIVVTITPSASAGETTEDQQNNTTETTGSPISLSKLLYLTLPETPQVEGSVKTIRCQLARSGDWRSNETFTVKTIKGDSRISLPETIFIPRDQAATYFYLPMADNGVCDTDTMVSFSVEGNGYPAVTGQIVIEDDEQPSLSVTASKSVVSEGETFQLTITASRAPAEDLAVTLTSENTKRFTYPRKAIIPAGQTSVTVDVTAKDDDLPGQDLSNAFTASAPRYTQGEVIVLLQDNDMPVLQLVLTPNKIAEGAGPVSVAGVLRRTGVTNNKITVRLGDDSNGGLYFTTRELTLNADVEEASFNFGPIDNTQVDGDRTYTVTAAVWLSSCSCSAAGESAGSVSAQLQVLDDDGPALTLTSTMSTIKEGGKATLTVSRNTTASLDKPLTVSLSSDYDANLSYAHTVTIPAGQQTAQVEVTSTKNDVSDDTHTVVFTAQADGFATGTCWLMVTDQTLPDAVISSITVDKTETEAGNDVVVSLIVTNTGISVLPSGIEVSLYADTYQRTIKTYKSLEVGESTELKADLTMPVTIGSVRCYAIINESMVNHELSYNNNTSQNIFVSTVAPYKTNVSTDKSVYRQGECININGSLSGHIETAQNVEVYFIHNGNRFVQSAITDNDGNFVLKWEPFQGMYGKVSIGACYEGEKSVKEMTNVTIVGLKQSDSEPILLQPIVGGNLKGEIEINNPTVLKQTGLSIQTLTKPANLDVTFSIDSDIKSEGTAMIKYSINPLLATQGTDWQKVELRVTSNEGASLDITIRIYARNEVATLQTSENTIKTTVTKGDICNYSLSLINTGNGETGNIALSLPEWRNCAMGNTLPSLQKNGVMNIVLQIKPTEDMPLNKPRKGTIGINCQNGNGVRIDYEITPVETAIGTLIVDAVDTYTYNTPEAPHVNGAKVELFMPISNEIIATGITDADGLYVVDLPAGYYQMEISTQKHDKYFREVYVAPSIDNNVLAILQYEPITVNWSVTETEVEDEYAIVNEIDYETNVPMPVIILGSS